MLMLFLGGGFWVFWFEDFVSCLLFFWVFDGEIGLFEDVWDKFVLERVRLVLVNSFFGIVVVGLELREEGEGVWGVVILGMVVDCCLFLFCLGKEICSGINIKYENVVLNVIGRF